jgi:outer membrane protein assembly factor BamB
LDAATGEEIWAASSGDRAQSFCGSPCVSDGFVFLTTFNFYGLGTVRCVNASDGSLVWIKEIQRSDGTPAVHDGRLYVTGGVSGVSEHQTYCFDTVDGTPLWSTTVEADIGGWTCSVVIADGKAFVGRDAGTVGEMGGRYVKLFALDEMTGAIRWEVDGCGATVAVFDGEVFSAGSDGRVYAFGP